MKKWMCMISLAYFSKRKCHFNPLDQRSAEVCFDQVSFSPLLSKMTQSSHNIQPFFPLILFILHSALSLKATLFCLIFFKVTLPQNAKSTRIFMSE